MKNNIEQRTAETLLQKEVEIEVCGKKYKVAQPTIATLVLASEAIGRMPSMELDRNDILNETIAIAPDCKAVAEVIAIFILGAKRIKSHGNSLKSKVFGLFGFEKGEFEKLTDEIYFNASPSELNKVLSECIMSMEIGDFFGLTTTLLGVNLTRAKLKKATASGR